MSNTIKYSESTEQRALNKGNWWIGTGDSNKGPSNVTGFYAGVTPPSSGYTIYTKREDNLPSIFVAQNDQELIFLTNQISESNFTTTQECLNYFQGQDDKLCMNREYENIVTDGLVLNLDAGHVSSYPTTNTTFYDLSGNDNNGNLINGTIFSGGSMVFDGVDDRINIVGVDTYNQYTFEVIMKRTTTPSYDYESFLLNSGESYGAIDRIGISINLRFNWRYRKPDASYATLQSGTNYVQLNEIAILCGTYDGNDVRFYKNGILTDTFSSISFYDNWGGTFQLGANLINNAYFNGNIYSFKTYNRAITSTEVLQNYNAQKGRFGL